MTRPFRFGFILSTSLGNATRYKILRKFADRDDSVECTWAPVKHYYAIGERNPVAWVPSPLRSRAIVLAQASPILARLRRFDAVMIHQLEAQPVALALAALAGRPLIVAAQDNPPIIDPANYPPYPEVLEKSIWRAKVRLWSELAIARATPCHITFSDWQRNVLVEKCRIPSDRVHTIHIGIDLSEWSASKRNQSDPGKKPSILFVGGDFLRKGGAMLCDVFVEHFGEQATLDIVTSGPIHWDHPSITIHHGLTPGDPELRRLYQNADIFALPTQADLSPWVCLEAMACKLPIIASNVGGVGDMVDGGVTGLLVSPGDPAELQQALARLIVDAPLRLSMGAAGRARIERDFDASINVPRILAVMKEACIRRSLI